MRKKVFRFWEVPNKDINKPPPKKHIFEGENCVHAAEEGRQKDKLKLCFLLVAVGKPLPAELLPSLKSKRQHLPLHTMADAV